MKVEKFVLRSGGILTLSLLLLRPEVFAQRYIETNLVSSIPGVGTNPTNPLDPQLVNSWGITRSPTSPWWIADNGTGLATIYNGVGTKQGLVVTIPPPMGGAPPAAPTGTVFNGTSDFKLGGLPAAFIFVTEDGTISAWNGGTTATIVADNSKKNAVYKGCTIGEFGGQHYLYVTNFRSGKIEVYDTNFNPVVLNPAAFAVSVRGTDPDQSKLVPFNVQAIGTNVYVTYAKQDDMKHDDVKGPGLGGVVVFDTGGTRLARLQQGVWFNAPWGIVLAPGEFGEFSHSLLVGMFGSGQIAAFNPVNGSFLRLMVNPDFSTLAIDGLWGLAFGAGNASSGPYNTLFFTAGPNSEGDGLFGTLVALPAELSEADEP
jgi:uncharacterized protein (TIGR03118 family)